MLAIPIKGVVKCLAVGLSLTLFSFLFLSKWQAVFPFRGFAFALALLCLHIFKKLVKPLANGAQAEFLSVDVFGSEPETLGGIVHGLQLALVFHLAAEKEVERMHVESSVAVNVWLAKQVLAIGNGEPRFFFHLAPHAFFGRFVGVLKAAGQVECAFPRVFFAAFNK